MRVRSYLLVLLSVCLTPARFTLAAAPPVNYAEHIAPIMKARCAACHTGEKSQAGLDVNSAPAILRGGNSGQAVKPGRTVESLLLAKITTGQMPPGPAKLSAAEIDLVRRWIDAGAPADAGAGAGAPAATASSSFSAAAPQNSGTTHAALSEDDILPIFQIRCLECHGKRQQLGGLDLRTRASRLKGGKSGPGMVPGKPESSLIVKRIESGQMPPMDMLRDYAIRPPTASEVEKLKSWIAAGAPDRLNAAEGSRRGAAAVTSAPDYTISGKDRQFWSFLPPRRVDPPRNIKAGARVRNPIDAFLLARLEAKGLSYAGEAGPLKLMRRAYLDLTGMPPTPAEVTAYLKEAAVPGAYERLVDRLLESPHYGERWGRYWLDLAGYADSEGFGQDDGVRPFMWRYRDYVIRAFNSDKPYSQFLLEQIAGDELAPWKDVKPVTPQLVDRIAATGFLRTVPDPTNATERAFIQERMNILADEVEVLTSSVMGVTVGCARCHNHKYDPIPQRDYYRLSAILQTSYDPYDWLAPKKREIPLAVDSEWEDVARHNTPIEADIKRLEAKLDELARPYRAEAKDEKLAIDKLFGRFPEFKAKGEPAQKEINALRGKLKPKPHVRGLTDTGGVPSAAYLLKRGDPTNMTEPVEPGVPLILSNGIEPYKVVEPYPGADSSGRRLAFARWLTQPDHPLTARVWVNQMWLRHFGRGIVASPSNFGRSGVAPSHPELLDWLATEFVRTGWSIKSMHRVMMTSSAYRQASVSSGESLAADPENILVSRMPLRRLDSDALYDSVLRASGRLNPRRFGPPEQIETRPDKEVVPKGAPEGYRRSVYVLHKRQSPVTMFDVFDQPAMTPNCIERRQSTVSTQALQMMNGTIVWEHAKYMAGRIIDEIGDDSSEQVEQAFLRALGRSPRPPEKQELVASYAEFARLWPERIARDNPQSPQAHLAKWMSLTTVCHTLLNSAEFAYVD